MVEAHYPLQALLYNVALHRYLRWRQPGYDPAAQLGGVLYLFLRGMCGPAVVGARRLGARGVRLAAAGRAGHRRCPTCWRGCDDQASTRRWRCGPTGCSRTFNQAGILSAADVHVARRLGAIAGETDRGGAARGRAGRALDAARFGGASTSTRPRRRRARTSTRTRPTRRWSRSRSTGRRRLGGAVRGEPAGRRARQRPLRMLGSQALAGAVLGPGGAGRARAARAIGVTAPTTSTWPCSTAGLDRLFKAGADDDQRAAAARVRAVAGQCAGGWPGDRQDHDGLSAAGPAARSSTRTWRIALAAPTGKAAARLEEAVHVVDGDTARQRTVHGSVSCTRRRCTGCSAGGRSRAAGSGTTGPTGCPSRSSSSTRARWCR